MGGITITVLHRHLKTLNNQPFQNHRQIGLKSRMVGGFDKGDGHAFAEFLLPDSTLSSSQLNRLDYRKDYNGVWISLDWFKGSDHNRFTHDIQIFDDI